MFDSKPKNRTRFAPTPSGFLHIGNVFNLIYCWLVAKKHHAELWLRIDDLDQERTKDIYLENIFQTIDWLGVQLDNGPSNIQDFKKNWSQITRLELYSMFKNSIMAQNLVFACECSRKQLNADVNDYAGNCLTKKLPIHNNTVLRNKPYVLDIKLKELDSTDLSKINENHFYGYSKMIQIFKKEGNPSYQLASLLDDFEMKMTHIVRGEDLLESSQMQVYLSKILNLSHFEELVFLHHKLVLDNNNQKISKSVLTNSQQKIIEKYSQKEVISLFAKKYLKEEKAFENLEQLLEVVQTKTST